jgi:hypothetical protein
MATRCFLLFPWLVVVIPIGLLDLTPWWNGRDENELTGAPDDLYSAVIFDDGKLRASAEIAPIHNRLR